MNDSILKDRWFVDIKGQIRPMTTPQIIKGLIEGELKVIFRVSRDRATWNAICNEPYFESIIQSMVSKIGTELTRYGSEKSGQTGGPEQTGFHNLTNISTSINQQLEHAKNLQEMNLQLQGLRFLASEIVAKRKLVIDLSNVKESEDLHPDDQNEIIEAPGRWQRIKATFSWSDPQGRQKLVALVLTILVISLFVSKYIQRQKEKTAEEARLVAQAALHAKEMGEFDKAVALFSGVKDLSNIDSKTLIEIAQAQIEMKKFDSSIAMLNRVLLDSKTPGDLSRAKALLGLISMRKNDFVAASTFYEDALKGEPIYSALYNLAVLNLNKGDGLQAETLFLKALEYPGHDKGPVLLGLFEAAFMLDRKGEQTKVDNNPSSYPRLEKTNTLLFQGTDPLDPYHDENLAARIVIAATLNHTDDFNTLVSQWMNIDFRRALAKRPELDIDYERTTWAHIYDWCVDIYKDPNVGVMKSAFFAGCVARAKSAIEALPYAQYAADHLTGDANARGYLGHIMFLTGDIESAKQILRSGVESNSILGKNTLKEICEKKPDADCNAPSAAADQTSSSKKSSAKASKTRSRKK